MGGTATASVRFDYCLSSTTSPRSGLLECCSVVVSTSSRLTINPSFAPSIRVVYLIEQVEAIQTMSLVEKLLFGIFTFQALLLLTWFVFLRREIKEEKKKQH
jgi:hypothetical protein